MPHERIVPRRAGQSGRGGLARLGGASLRTTLPRSVCRVVCPDERANAIRSSEPRFPTLSRREPRAEKVERRTHEVVGAPPRLPSRTPIERAGFRCAFVTGAWPRALGEAPARCAPIEIFAFRRFPAKGIDVPENLGCLSPYARLYVSPLLHAAPERIRWTLLRGDSAFVAHPTRAQP